MASTGSRARSVGEIAAYLTNEQSFGSDALYRALTSSDFAGVLADAATTATGAALAADLLAVVLVLPTNRIADVSMPGIDAGG